LETKAYTWGLKRGVIRPVIMAGAARGKDVVVATLDWGATFALLGMKERDRSVGFFSHKTEKEESVYEKAKRLRTYRRIAETSHNRSWKQGVPRTILVLIKNRDLGEGKMVVITRLSIRCVS